MIFKVYAGVVLMLVALMMMHMTASMIRDAYYILTLPPLPAYENQEETINSLARYAQSNPDRGQ